MKHNWLIATAAVMSATTAHAYDYYIPALYGAPFATYYATPQLDYIHGDSVSIGGRQYVTKADGTTVPFDDSLFAFGDGGSLATFQTNHANASVRATAHAEGYPNGASASVELIYALKIIAGDSAIADQIDTILRTSPLASASGAYIAEANTYGEATVSASSGFTSVGYNNGFVSICYDRHKVGCSSGSYTFNLGFWRGTNFVDGDANTFYGELTIAVIARASTDRYNPGSSDALAFIDPTIEFAAPLRRFGNGVTYDFGGLGNGGFAAGGPVPEPASWALLIGGFGLVGAATRKRRRTKAGFAR